MLPTHIDKKTFNEADYKRQTSKQAKPIMEKVSEILKY